MSDKIRVLWICHFSTEEIRNCIEFTSRYSSCKIPDFGIWNVNAIKQFEKCEDIELYVVFPHLGMKNRYQEFSLNGIHYICFKSEDDHLFARIIRKIFKYQFTSFRKNRKFISSIINRVKPDIVHIIGAENPYYSLGALEVPDSIPCVVSLQTLMVAPDFLTNYPISQKLYEYRVKVEKMVINKATYIATSIDSFRKGIIELIKKDAVFLNMDLAMGKDIDASETEKEYDFVYFAKNINKACDYAIEAFAIALSVHPGLTLNISGDYDYEYKSVLDNRIKELDISDNVFFTGPKDTHGEVISQIKKSKFALLPLKVDFISTTILEAMACGLPVITTITPGTPSLNLKRESVLLSEKGDFEAMADNMLKVVNNNMYANELRRNSFETINESYSNKAITSRWKQAYHAIVENIHNGTPIPREIISF